MLFRSPGVSADYNKHISFFFDPIDPMVVDQVYGKFHHFWAHGATVYEHVVDSRQIGKFNYHITETPEKIEILYDDSISTKRYYELLEQINKTNHYLGTEREFDQAAKKFVGQTSKYQKKVHTYPNWNDIKNKYAACVPHVMLYPDKGYCKVLSSRSLTIGKT